MELKCSIYLFLVLLRLFLLIELYGIEICEEPFQVLVKEVF